MTFDLFKDLMLSPTRLVVRVLDLVRSAGIGAGPLSVGRVKRYAT